MSYYTVKVHAPNTFTAVLPCVSWSDACKTARMYRDCYHQSVEILKSDRPHYIAGYTHNVYLRAWARGENGQWTRVNRGGR